MKQNIMYSEIKNIHFIGIFGVGMSAIAQFLNYKGMIISGSDRFFEKEENKKGKVQKILEKEGIACSEQKGERINEDTDLVVISTAIESNNPEIKKSEKLNIPIIHRAELLKLITEDYRTIAVGGTSGKSTTVAILYHILEQNNISPSLITGAGLRSLEEQGRIGNAVLGKSDWLIIEADESDGSIVNYKAETGILLNISKDHKEVEELVKIFSTFAKNTKSKFIINKDCLLSKSIKSKNNIYFGTNSDYQAKNFRQKGLKIEFELQDTYFEIPVIGEYNMQNAISAIIAAETVGVTIEQSAVALRSYRGIHRRMNIRVLENGLTLIDDYAHNPSKVAAAIKAAKGLNGRVLAWFQPHGFKPTSFLKDEFVSEIFNVLGEEDKIFMSEIYYAGGTANKNISSANLINELKHKGCDAYFIEKREELFERIKGMLKKNDIILLMGARDPSLYAFASEMSDKLRSIK